MFVGSRAEADLERPFLVLIAQRLGGEGGGPRQSQVTTIKFKKADESLESTAPCCLEPSGLAQSF